MTDTKPKPKQQFQPSGEVGSLSQTNQSEANIAPGSQLLNTRIEPSDWNLSVLIYKYLDYLKGNYDGGIIKPFDFNRSIDKLTLFFATLNLTPSEPKFAGKSQNTADIVTFKSYFKPVSINRWLSSSNNSQKIQLSDIKTWIGDFFGRVDNRIWLIDKTFQTLGKDEQSFRSWEGLVPVTSRDYLNLDQKNKVFVYALENTCFNFYQYGYTANPNPQERFNLLAKEFFVRFSDKTQRSSNEARSLKELYAKRLACEIFSSVTGNWGLNRNGVTLDERDYIADKGVNNIYLLTPENKPSVIIRIQANLKSFLSREFEDFLQPLYARFDNAQSDSERDKIKQLVAASILDTTVLSSNPRQDLTPRPTESETPVGVQTPNQNDFLRQAETEKFLNQDPQSDSNNYPSDYGPDSNGPSLNIAQVKQAGTDPILGPAIGAGAIAAGAGPQSAQTLGPSFSNDQFGSQAANIDKNIAGPDIPQTGWINIENLTSPAPDSTGSVAISNTSSTLPNVGAIAVTGSQTGLTQIPSTSQQVQATYDQTSVSGTNLGLETQTSDSNITQNPPASLAEQQELEIEGGLSEQQLEKAAGIQTVSTEVSEVSMEPSYSQFAISTGPDGRIFVVAPGGTTIVAESSSQALAIQEALAKPTEVYSSEHDLDPEIVKILEDMAVEFEDELGRNPDAQTPDYNRAVARAIGLRGRSKNSFYAYALAKARMAKARQNAAKKRTVRGAGQNSPRRGVISTSRVIAEGSRLARPLDPQAQAEYDKLAAQGYQDITRDEIDREVDNLKRENGVLSDKENRDIDFQGIEEVRRAGNLSEEELNKTFFGQDEQRRREYEQWRNSAGIDKSRDYRDEDFDLAAMKEMQEQFGYSNEQMIDTFGEKNFKKMQNAYNQFSDSSNLTKKEFDPYDKDTTPDDLAKNGYDYVPVQDENGNTSYVPLGKNESGIGQEKEASADNLQKAEDLLENQIDKDRLIGADGTDHSKSMSPEDLERYGRQQRYLSDTRRNTRRQKQDALANMGKKALDAGKMVKDLANLGKLGSAIGSALSAIGAALGPAIPFIAGALIVLIVVISAVISIRQAYCTDDMMDLRIALEGAAAVAESQQQNLLQRAFNLTPLGLTINATRGWLESQNGQIALTEFGRQMIRTFCPERESALECGPGATGNVTNVVGGNVIDGAKGIACLALKEAPGLTPNMRALLRAISYIEGAPDKDGYSRLVGGRQIPGNTHPGVEDIGLFRQTGFESDAFGRYQMLSTTWTNWARVAGISTAKSGANAKGEPYYDMSPANQDLAVLKFLQTLPGLQQAIDANTESFESIVARYSDKSKGAYYGFCQWASVPTCSHQGQINQKSAQFYDIFRELQKEENSPGGCGAKAAVNKNLSHAYNPIKFIFGIEANAQTASDGLNLLVDGETGLTLKDNGRITQLDSSGGGIDYTLSFNGQNGNAATRGIPIVAHLQGEVTYVVGGQSGFVKGTQSGSFGNEVGVYYPSINLTAIYSHLDSVEVQKGQRVSPGTKLGAQGSTGSTVGAEGEFVHVSLNLFSGKVEGQVGASSDMNLYTSFMKETLKFYATNLEALKAGRFQAATAGTGSSSPSKCVCQNAQPVTFSGGNTGRGAPAGQKTSGKASFYGTGNSPGGDSFGPEDTTASGERFDPEGMTAAGMKWPLGTVVRVTNKSNNKSVVVKINDTGRFDELGRIIDLSLGAARKIDMIQAGEVDVDIEVVDKSTKLGSGSLLENYLTNLPKVFGPMQAQAQDITRPQRYGDISDGHKKFLAEIAKAKGYNSLPDAGKANPQMVVALNAMISAAAGDGIRLVVIAGESNPGYRTFDQQTDLYFNNGGAPGERGARIRAIWSENLSGEALNEVRRQYLERARNSAPPGFSEHSAGLAVDFNQIDNNNSFAGTAAYRWLQANASKFGFVESYPRNSTNGAEWESWHWRFDGNETYKLDKNINQLKLEGGQPVTTQPAGTTCPNQGPSGSANPTSFGGKKPGGFLYPVPKEVAVNSRYGFRPRFGKFHFGVDMAADVGTPIFASADGKVTYAGWSEGGFGNLVELDHGNGVKTLYAHNQRVLVKVGDTVEQGQQIAEMGSTGFSTGPHLHFEIHISGKKIDPCDRLDEC